MEVKKACLEIDIFGRNDYHEKSRLIDSVFLFLQFTKKNGDQAHSLCSLPSGVSECRWDCCPHENRGIPLQEVIHACIDILFRKAKETE
jgi:hypothetical protein